MARMQYFSDLNSQTTELTDGVRPMDNKEFVARFPGIRGIRIDSFSRLVGNDGKTVLPVTRRIEFKSNPSLHKCDARCQSAKGRICECSCRGKNHGASSFLCESLAA